VVNAKKALSVLQRGVTIVRRAVDGSTHVGAGYNEVERLAELSQRITWAFIVGNGVYAADGSTATSDVQVGVVDGAPPASLNQGAIFQAHQGYDGFPRIYVLPRRCTATWAGVLLFHELGHVLEHLEGASPLRSAGDDWWNSEARAYHRDALIVDALSGGRLLPALSKLAATSSASDLIGRDPDELSENLYWHAFGGRVPDPAKSTTERWARSATLAFSAVVTAAAHPVSLADLPRSSAGPELQRAATVWGWGAGMGTSFVAADSRGRRRSAAQRTPRSQPHWG
jgi:hypothetical protein